MNVFPLVGFWWRRSQQIEALLERPGGKPSPGRSSFVLDLATALVPIVKKNWPQLNENGLLDDALATAKEVFAPTPPPSP
jgi:hypothetical protein